MAVIINVFEIIRASTDVCGIWSMKYGNLFKLHLVSHCYTIHTCKPACAWVHRTTTLTPTTSLTPTIHLSHPHLSHTHMCPSHPPPPPYSHAPLSSTTSTSSPPLHLTPPPPLHLSFYSHISSICTIPISRPQPLPHTSIRISPSGTQQYYICCIPGRLEMGFMKMGVGSSISVIPGSSTSSSSPSDSSCITAVSMLIDWKKILTIAIILYFGNTKKFQNIRNTPTRLSVIVYIYASGFEKRAHLTPNAINLTVFTLS